MGNISEDYIKLRKNVIDLTKEDERILMKNIMHILELRSYSSWLLLQPESTKDGLQEQIDYCNEQLKLLLNL